MVLTPEGIARGWQVETMPSTWMMPDNVILREFVRLALKEKKVTHKRLNSGRQDPLHQRLRDRRRWM